MEVRAPAPPPIRTAHTPLVSPGDQPRHGLEPCRKTTGTPGGTRTHTWQLRRLLPSSIRRREYKPSGAGGGNRTHNSPLKRRLRYLLRHAGMEPPVGFEPTPVSFVARCSSVELRGQSRDGGSRTRFGGVRIHHASLVHHVPKVVAP